MQAGEGLRMTGPYIGASITGVDDMDGDGLPELYISTDVQTETGYLIPGADLKSAIEAGVLDFDLESRFNDESQ